MRGYQITAPHFVAGIEVGSRGIVTKAAPILQWTVGKTLNEIKLYCFGKGWKVEELR